MSEPRVASEQQIRELLADPGCPLARGIRDRRAVPVVHFILFARSRGFATTDLEASTDACVVSMGGTREPVVDPLGWLANRVRRATGNLPSAPEHVWLLPRLEPEAPQ